MYPFELLASQYARLGDPENLVERARRLFVLSPIIDSDMDWTPVRFRWSSRGFAQFTLDLRQGQDASLVIAPQGLVILGFVKGATAKIPKSVENLAPDTTSRELLATTTHLVDDWSAQTLCVWRTTSASSWTAAPQMLTSDATRNDSLGLCSLFTVSASDIGDFVAHMTESSSLGKVATSFMTTPDVNALCKRASTGECAAMIRERARTMNLLL